MEFSYTYFEDEVRDGFYVSSKMKRAWAAQLEVLEDIDRVCKKYNIQYFAEFGTLLGAIRHHGFIPWDDDLDICMKRPDYDKFINIAEEELKQYYEHYGILNVCSYENHDDVLIRIVNGREIRFDDKHLEKFHGCPYVVGIDIFPLDYVADDPELDEAQKEIIQFVSNVRVTVDDENKYTPGMEMLIQSVEEICNVNINREKPIKQSLFMLVDRLSSMYTEKDGSRLALMPLWVSNGRNCFPKSYFEKSIYVPFENTEIPVPVGYDALLKHKYGDYMKLYRDGGSHDYPFFKIQDTILENEFGRDPVKYVFSKKDLHIGENRMMENAKDQIFGLIPVIREAHMAILQYINQNNYGMVQQLLDDCKAGAMGMSALTASQKGNDFVTVKRMKEYEEQVIQLSQAVEQVIQLNMEVIPDEISELLYQGFNIIEEALDRIADSMKRDWVDRKEVVFLPYKASMWDSLESVWRAADADPDVDAYVIPVPYYDKNPDGSFRELHYEGDQFPKDVPITHYDDYLLDQRHPDTIFFHNPYDEHNYVTSVHPYFYSEKLREYCNQLVYIPYFVLGEINPNDQRAVSTMEHFCTVSGVINADWVVVQSESMRQAYIEALSKFAGEDTREIWEQRVLGLGSPKYDKIGHRKKEDIIIPEEWKDILEKSDGTYKKIVLYNTSVGALLEHQGKMLDKMRYVFDTFKNNQKEIALLWRPHPLIKATIQSMRPELLDEYESLVKEYKESKIGIYDDTSDLDRAIELSDAYYGDGSSLVQLCREAGIPIMMQNVDIID